MDAAADMRMGEEMDDVASSGTDDEMIDTGTDEEMDAVAAQATGTSKMRPVTSPVTRLRMAYVDAVKSPVTRSRTAKVDAAKSPVTRSKTAEMNSVKSPVTRSRAAEMDAVVRVEQSQTGEMDAVALMDITADAADEGPHFIPGMKPVLGTGQGNRQSVGMKFQLRIVESSIARLMQERDQIDQVIKCCNRAVKGLAEEERVLNDLANIMALQGHPGKNITPGEFVEFFYKLLVDGDFSGDNMPSNSQGHGEGTEDNSSVGVNLTLD